MSFLRENIAELKKIIQKKADKDKLFRKNFKEAITEVFGGIKILDFIKDFYFKFGKIFIQTQNKTFANELFLKKEIIIKKINFKNQISKIEKIETIIIK
jgi:hypothetical protein